MGPDVVDGENVRVVQGAGGAGFLLEADEMPAIGDLLGEDLDRHLALQAGVTRPVHLTHRPGGEQHHDLVRAESRAGLERHRCTPRCGLLPLGGPTCRLVGTLLIRRTDYRVGGAKYSAVGETFSVTGTIELAPLPLAIDAPWSAP